MASMNKIEILRFKKAIKNIKPRTKGQMLTASDIRICRESSNSHSSQITLPPGSTVTTNGIGVGMNALDAIADAANNAHSNNSQSPSSPHTNIVAVVVSQQEQDIHTNIISKHSLINDQLIEINENMKLLNNIKQQNKTKINSIRTELIKRINYRFNELIKESEFISTQKQSILNVYSDKLKAKQNELYNLKLRYNSYLVDEGMDIKQRKRKILAMNDEIESQNVEYIDVIPKVKVSLNKDELFHYVENIGNIRGYTNPKSPIISSQSATPSTVKIGFDNIKDDNIEVLMEIAEIDPDDDLNDDEEMKLDYHEIDDEDFERQRNDKYVINKLKDDQQYSLRARYKNRYGFSEYSKSLMIRTKKIGLLIDASSGILNGNQKQILCDLLNDRKWGFKKLKCIYSSIKHGFDVNKCHDLCQNRANILYIIHTMDGNIFGGFTKTKWITDNNIDRKDKDSFLFLLKSSSSKDYKSGYYDIICSQSMAIWYHSNYFCLMGTGYDISIYKTCNRTKTSNNGYTYISKGNYNTPTKYHLNAGKKTFSVKNIEIFSCV